MSNIFDDVLSGAAEFAINSAPEQAKQAEIAQKTYEWHISRLGKISNSMLPVLMTRGRGEMWGATAISYLNKLKVERTLSDDGRDIYVRQLMAKEYVQTNWGIMYEPDARKLFELRADLDTYDAGFVQRETIENYGGSVDFMAEDGCPGEIKCPFDTVVHEENLQTSYSDLPKNHKYFAQCQGHILLTGANICYFVSYDPRRRDEDKLAIITVTRDDMYQNELKERIVLANEAIEKAIKDRISIDSILRK